MREALLTAAAAGGPGLVDAESGATWTWSQVLREALRLAAWLRQAGTGTRVALVLPNSVAHAMLDLACAIDGVTISAFHPGTPTAELRARANALGCEVVVASPSLSASLAEEGARVLTLAADPAANVLPAPLEERELRAPGPEQLFSLVQTSGTTGRSRACAISAAGALHSARATAQAFGRTRGTRYLTPLPLFHTNAQVVGLLTSLLTQGTLIVGPRLTAERLWAAVERTGAEGLSLVPAIVHDLVRLDRPAPACLRYAVTSSAAMPPGLHRAFERSTGIPLCSSYGLSEASGLVTFGYPGQPEGTVGKVVGSELSLGADREVLLRGPALFLRYELDEEATAKTLRDGWLHTGDMGQLDADGNLTLLGRLKDLINRGGEKVAPLDVEAALLRHPAVREACAFGVPDPRLGEKVAVALVFAEGQRVSAEVLREACVDVLADHMLPELWWEVASLPRGPTQKVLRRELQAHVGAHGRALEE